MIHEKNYEFSFSGLKTAVLYYLRDHPEILKSASRRIKALVCASFQQAAIDVLVTKTLCAAQEYKTKSILLCGGVAANKALQNEFKKRIKNLELRSKGQEINFFVPEFKYNTDNAVMIAAAAYVRQQTKKKKYPLAANGNLGV